MVFHSPAEPSIPGFFPGFPCKRSSIHFGLGREFFGYLSDLVFFLL